MTELKIRENMRKLSGRVFHVVQDRNLLRYRITDSGKVVRDKVRREMRKRVTGDPEKKIRDYMTEVPQVKLIDKVYFTFGVACVVLTEYLALRHPSYFTQYYYLLLSFLVTIRFFQYKEENMELFLLDFCYFANLSTMIQTGVFPDCLMWYKANYVLCMGCLMLAIVVWQNSLVFHSLDKITSFLLHALPPLTLHMYRWHLIPNDVVPMDDTLSWTESFVWPLILYSSWQALYIFILDVPLAETLRKDPEKITSIRYLVKDKKNGMHQLVVSICRKHGWMGPQEELDADSMKAKVIFMASQLVFTIFTILVVPFLYNNYTLSVVYIASIYMWCVWRGGSYYIEVFSERYKLKFINQYEIQIKKADHKDDSDDEVFEDAELFSEIVTALSEESKREGGRLGTESDDTKPNSSQSHSDDDEQVETTTHIVNSEPVVVNAEPVVSSEPVFEQAKTSTNTQAAVAAGLSQTLDNIISGLGDGKLEVTSVKLSQSSTVTVQETKSMSQLSSSTTSNSFSQVTEHSVTSQETSNVLSSTKSTEKEEESSDDAVVTSSTLRLDQQGGPDSTSGSHDVDSTISSDQVEVASPPSTDSSLADQGSDSSESSFVNIRRSDSETASNNEAEAESEHIEVETVSSSEA